MLEEYKVKMKFIHHISISIFVKEGEDSEKTLTALLEFLPEDLEKEKISIEKEEAKIDEGKNMDLYRVYLSKERHVKYTFKQLKDGLGPQQCERIILQENRVDEQGNLYIRIERKPFEEDGTVLLTDGGDCYHFKITLAAFPKTRENALAVVKKLFGAN